MSSLTELLGIRHPIVQAPMANGPNTVDLVVAVSEAGALGSIAGATLSPDELRAEIRAVRERTPRPFAVNLFAPLPPPRPDPEGVDRLQRLLAPHRARRGLPDPGPRPARSWTLEDQLDVVVDERVPVFSFTFGIPPLDGLGDTVLIGTATTEAEAVALERARVHLVVAQAAEAGGHRGTFVGSFEESLVPLATLVPEVVDAVSVPVLAAGGIVDGRGIAAAFALGAAGVQLGTAFLFAHESGASPAWRRALRECPTVVTDAYSGRPARGARTPFVDELMASGRPAPYPLQAALIGDLREHDGYGWYLGGAGAPRARELPAADLVATLVKEMEAARLKE